jgi:hypothetical protein
VITNQVTITTAQVTVIAAETECQPFFGGEEETAWACGDFIRPGKNWAMSFQCCAGGGPTVEPGAPADFAKGLGVRFRSFANTGGDEVFMGVGDLGTPPRGDYGYSWSKPGSHDFTFSFDGDTTLSVDLDGSMVESYDISADLFKTGCSLADLDRLEIVVANRDTGTTVNLNDLTLDGADLGSLTGDGFSVWNISDSDFSAGFTFTGTVQLDGAFSNSQELSRIELLVGCEDTTN